jgi:hypothetical protein
MESRAALDDQHRDRRGDSRRRRTRSGRIRARARRTAGRRRRRARRSDCAEPEPDAPAVPPSPPRGPAERRPRSSAPSHRNWTRPSDAYVQQGDRRFSDRARRSACSSARCAPCRASCPATADRRRCQPEQRLAGDERASGKASPLSSAKASSPAQLRDVRRARDARDGLDGGPGFAEAMCEACQGNGFIDARHVQRAALDVAPRRRPVMAAAASATRYRRPMLASPAPPSGQVSQGGYSFSPTPGGSGRPVRPHAGAPAVGPAVRRRGDLRPWTSHVIGALNNTPEEVAEVARQGPRNLPAPSFPTTRRLPDAVLVKVLELLASKTIRTMGPQPHAGGPRPALGLTAGRPSGRR